MRKTLSIFLILAIAGLTTYALRNSSSPPALDWRARDALLSELGSQLQELANEIKTVQGRSDCDTEEQCETLGLGTPICDDYKDYLVYSTKDANLARLIPLVRKFNEVHAKVSNLSTVAGQCGIKPDKAHCVGGHCTTR